jgi:hypothetical protein
MPYCDHFLFGFAARSEEDVKNGALRLNCMGDYRSAERHMIEWCEGPLGATLEHDADFELLIPDHIGLALAAHIIDPSTRWRNVLDVHRVQYFAFNSVLTMLGPSEESKRGVATSSRAKTASHSSNPIFMLL